MTFNLFFCIFLLENPAWVNDLHQCFRTFWFALPYKREL